jgi:DNA-binding NarL/FixJ family response regulator
MSKMGRMKALVLEDDALVARAVERSLKVRGATSTLVGTCAEALAIEDTFDIGVFDVDLPDGDGIDVADELHRRGTVQLVVFFSGQDHPELVRRAQMVGPFVHKSDGASALLEAVGAALVCQMQADAVAVGEESTPTPRRRGNSGIRRRFPR